MSWRSAAIGGGLLAGAALGLGMYFSTRIIVDAVVHWKTAHSHVH